MASVRSFKKDIHFLASELVLQAYFSKHILKSINDEKLSEIIDDAINFRNNFIQKVNHPDGKSNPKLVKKYYVSVRKDLVKQFGEIEEKINPESQAK